MANCYHDQLHLYRRCFNGLFLNWYAFYDCYSTFNVYFHAEIHYTFARLQWPKIDILVSGFAWPARQELSHHQFFYPLQIALTHYGLWVWGGPYVILDNVLGLLGSSQNELFGLLHWNTCDFDIWFSAMPAIYNLKHSYNLPSRFSGKCTHTGPWVEMFLVSSSKHSSCYSYQR